MLKSLKDVYSAIFRVGKGSGSYMQGCLFIAHLCGAAVVRVATNA